MTRWLFNARPQSCRAPGLIRRPGDNAWRGASGAAYPDRFAARL